MILGPEGNTDMDPPLRVSQRQFQQSIFKESFQAEAEQQY